MYVMVKIVHSINYCSHSAVEQAEGLSTSLVLIFLVILVTVKRKCYFFLLFLPQLQIRMVDAVVLLLCNSGHFFKQKVENSYALVSLSEEYKVVVNHKYDFFEEYTMHQLTKQMLTLNIFKINVIDFLKMLLIRTRVMHKIFHPNSPKLSLTSPCPHKPPFQQSFTSPFLSTQFEQSDSQFLCNNFPSDHQFETGENFTEYKKRVDAKQPIHVQYQWL